MAKSWDCYYQCGAKVSEYGLYVKISSSKYAHVSCFSEALLRGAIETGREQVLAEQREALRAERERQEQAARASQERERAKKLAEENLRNERERVKTLTQQAQEQIKREAQGEAQDRFLLLEIDPADSLRLAMEKQAQEDALRVRQEADALALKTCVRCKTVMEVISTEHPRHCPKCWNDEGTGQGANIPKQDLEQDIKDALKRGVRPLEIE